MEIQFSSTLKRFLSPGEAIRGEPVTLTFFATNLGKRKFPGGKVQNWRVDFGDEVRHTSPTAIVDCKPIPPGDKVRLLSEEVMTLTEGLAWAKFSIKPKGEKGSVYYYQSPTERLPGNEWEYCFYVVDRQMVQLSSSIEKLIEKLETLKG